MFELLPGLGVRLPGAAGTLRFGLDERATAQALAGLGPLLPRPVPDAAWSRTARWADVEVTAGAVESDVDAAEPGEALLHSVVLSRGPSAAHAPGGTPVVLADVDLFGYPAAEVLEALGDGLPAELSLRPRDRRGYLTSVTLRAAPPPPPPGRRSRAAAQAAETERAVADHRFLWTTERDRWQLLEAGGGHLVQRRDAPFTQLLICDDALAQRITAEMLAAGVEVVPERP
ncbi:hypothetical protein ACFWP2_19565 [Kitasatospora sp. NPDC058444]|uniref:hypothetical protein n=1 Tax=Kitasatospora sp. NPDC058444 TaxID=3346504 RepID=UPI003647B900